MNNSKTFFKIFIGFLTGFVLFNAIIWNFAVKKLIYPQNGYFSGDLTRTGYTFIGYTPRKQHYTLKEKHLEIKDFSNQKIDVLTLGDSFFNGGVSGENQYIQDYIENIHNLRTLNICVNKKKTNLDVLIMMLNNGYLDKIKPKYVILESVERHTLHRYSKPADFSQSVAVKNLNDYYEYNTKSHYDNLMDFWGFINNANFKFVLYSILRNFSDNALYSTTYIKKLSENFFSNPKGDMLLFYSYDLSGIEMSEDIRNIKILNDNYNKLSKKLKEKNITLYFMPVVDKYNLYEPYIINNKYPRSTFFEKFRPLKKDYVFVDTKQILSNELKKGTKDIFFADDSHWTNNGSKAVVENMRFR